MNRLLFLLPLALMLGACVPSTPEARIAENPGAFQSLSSKDQALVRQGRIEEGMHPKAVRLAWGNPAREYEGEDSGKNTRVWEYDRDRPVYTTNFYGGYGYGRYGVRHYAFDLGPEIAYVPYRVATVWFRNDRVTKWERVR
ncbi:hypothetical protein [Haloferula sargassicola]|uniref:Lipoprotein n=1 Tax=Haloferula sargassicola TaxID=490096 RepID=A0ABP9ULA8_9BACT